MLTVIYELFDLSGFDVVSLIFRVTHGEGLSRQRAVVDDGLE